MITILDNVLCDKDFSYLKELLELLIVVSPNTMWYEIERYEDPSFKKLRTIAGDYFDLSNLVGYEAWIHNNTIPIGDNDDGWHKDRDELSYHVKKVFRFPICSMVFYTDIKNLQGGELLVEDTTITPKENRLVLFGPGYNHKVNEFEGTRVSLSINPWNRKLESYA